MWKTAVAWLLFFYVCSVVIIYFFTMLKHFFTYQKGCSLSGTPLLIYLFYIPSKLHTELVSFRHHSISHFVFTKCSWSSPQTISNSQLHVLPHFHLCPIYLVLFKGFYFFKRMGYLILGGTSRLDAFSVYSFRTWLPGDAIGMTAGTPVVRPARSSRTKASSPQISYARAG